jgi:hypothetical protein
VGGEHRQLDDLFTRRHVHVRPAGRTDPDRVVDRVGHRTRSGSGVYGDAGWLGFELDAGMAPGQVLEFDLQPGAQLHQLGSQSLDEAHIEFRAVAAHQMYL